MADKLEKSRLVRFVKVFEVGIMAVAGLGFAERSVPILLASLFLMGIHSTVFGPIKYSILPQHLREEELVGGNALIESGTYRAGDALRGLPGVGATSKPTSCAASS